MGRYSRVCVCVRVCLMCFEVHGAHRHRSASHRVPVCLAWAHTRSLPCRLLPQALAPGLWLAGCEEPSVMRPTQGNRGQLGLRYRCEGLRPAQSAQHEATAYGSAKSVHDVLSWSSSRTQASESTLQVHLRISSYRRQEFLLCLLELCVSPAQEVRAHRHFSWPPGQTPGWRVCVLIVGDGHARVSMSVGLATWFLRLAVT